MHTEVILSHPHLFAQLATVTYDRSAYETAMADFQRTTRTTWFPHGVVADGLDHCYDCATEVHVLAAFIKKHGTAEQQLDVDASVAGMSGDINEALDPVRTPATEH